MKGMAAAAMGCAVILAGCGSRSGNLSISHSMSSQQVQKQILKQMKKWNTTDALVNDTVQIKGEPPKTYHIRLRTRANPPSVSLVASSSQTPTVTMTDNSHIVQWYASGSNHYLVLSQWPYSPDDFQLMGLELRSILSSAQVDAVHFSANNRVVLDFPAKLPNGLSVQAQLEFNLTTNLPVQLTASWPDGEVTESVSSYQINPNLTSGFEFSFPLDVTPQVGIGPGTDIFHPARQVVPFPITLPPSSANVTLEDVHYSPGAKPVDAVVLLAYRSSQGSPLVVTERYDHAASPPPSVNLTSEEMGNLSVRLGPLPLSQEFAEFTSGKVNVWVEGSPSEVDRFLDEWGSLPLPPVHNFSAQPSSPD